MCDHYMMNLYLLFIVIELNSSFFFFTCRIRNFVMVRISHQIHFFSHNPRHYDKVRSYTHFLLPCLYLACKSLEMRSMQIFPVVCSRHRMKFAKLLPATSISDFLCGKCDRFWFFFSYTPSAVDKKLLLLKEMKKSSAENTLNLSSLQ